MAAEFDNIPILDGWVNLTEAAEMLGITRQHAYKKTRLANEGKPNGWKTVRRVGGKPMYVVSIREIDENLAHQTSGTAKDEPVVTEIWKGTLSPEDRTGFLREWDLPPETTDDQIRLAMGVGLY